MHEVKVHFRDEYLWNKSGTTYTRGSAFLDEELISGAVLSQLFSQEHAFDGFLSLLRRLNGFFAIVHQVDGSLFLAVDHLRSCPLFYGSGMNGVYVSDDPYWIRNETGDWSVDELSAAELLLAGFVTGSDTLSPNVKQVQPGEALTIQYTTGKMQVTPVRYYEFIHSDFYVDSSDQLEARLDASLKASFNRLVRWARGRTIVVPLSGGCDSRLVVLMLKRLGYKDVVAFSYGRPGNDESKISKQVASATGVRWEFVPYSNAAWRKWHDSEEWKRYSQMADGLASVPHLQDWPAVFELRKQELIPQDAVFVPGNLAYSSMVFNIQPVRYPLVCSKTRVVKQKEILGSIHRAFYPMRDWARQSVDLKRQVDEKILRLLGSRPSYTPEEANSAYSWWWWQGFESRFVTNAVRVYEFWGYEWWLPLWDLEIARFWSRVPMIHRLGKRLQRSHLQKLELGTVQHNTRQCGTSSGWFSSGLVRKTRLYNRVRRLHGLTQYDQHPLAWYAIIPRQSFNSLYNGPEVINSYLAIEMFQRIFPTCKQLEVVGDINSSRP